MPLTFPSHPAAVLPLKLWRPRLFDGVALAIGSMTPDLAYVFDGSGLPVWPFSHETLGLFGWCLPIALVGTWVTRRAAPIIAAHLPKGGPLALRDYGSLRTARHRWWITVYSVLLGGASHLILDQLEHSVSRPNIMHVLGAVGMLAILLTVGRRRLLRDWYGDPPPVRRQPGLFWLVAGIVALPAIAVVPFLPGAVLAHTTGVRLLAAIAAGLLAGSVVAAVIAAGHRRAGGKRQDRQRERKGSARSSGTPEGRAVQ